EMGPRGRGKGNGRVSRRFDEGQRATGFGPSARLRVLVLIGALLWMPLSAVAKDDFLPPQQAYKYSVRAVDDEIFVTWTIEPGYYLYKNKMSVASPLSSVQLGEPKWPRGEDHEDEYFGRQ